MKLKPNAIRTDLWFPAAAGCVAASTLALAQLELGAGADRDLKARIAEDSPFDLRLTIPQEGGAVQFDDGGGASSENEVVWTWEGDRSKSVLPSKPSAGDEWSKARVVLAKREGDRLAVMFELQWEKSDPLTEATFRNISWFESKTELEDWSGKIQLFRVFRRNEDGEWNLEFTAFPETFWHSVRDEIAVDILMGDVGEYTIRYAGVWVAERDPKSIITQRKERVSDDGTTERKFIYDMNNELLLTETVSGERVCVVESVWWLVEDALPVGVHDTGNLRLGLLFKHQGAARHAGFELVNNETL